jgi:hypothetical protein
MEIKHCPVCEKDKPIDEFYNSRGTKTGKSGYCKTCSNEDGRTRRESGSFRNLPDNKKKEIYSRINANRQSLRRRDPLRAMLSRSKKGAKQRGLEFTITSKDIDFVDTCPVFGIPLEQTVGGIASYNSRSLDRTDSAKGYVPGNVKVMSFRANTLKSNATIEELESVVAYMKAERDKQAA